MEYALALQGIGGSMCSEFAMLEIMEKYGWTYDEYMNTPDSILKHAIAKISTEAQVANMKSKESSLTKK